MFISGAVVFALSVIIICRDIFSANFSYGSLGLLFISLALFILGKCGNKFAWSLAAKKGFVYDYASDTCKWDNREKLSK